MGPIIGGLQRLKKDGVMQGNEIAYYFNYFGEVMKETIEIFLEKCTFSKKTAPSSFHSKFDIFDQVDFQYICTT